MGAMGAEMRRWSPRWSATRGRLIAECEAFVTGQLAELCEQRDGSVPVWAWTNLLAHGSEEQLRRAHGTDYRRPTAPGDHWRAARSYVAGEVLALAVPFGSLQQAQRQVLVPIELELAGSVEVNCWSPKQWVAAVLAGVSERSRARRH
jgi:hypothetical protein